MKKIFISVTFLILMLASSAKAQLAYIEAANAKQEVIKLTQEVKELKGEISKLQDQILKILELMEKQNEETTEEDQDWRGETIEIQFIS